MQFSHKVILSGIIGIVIGFSLFLSPLPNEIAKSQNQCLYLFNEYAGLFSDVSTTDREQANKILQSEEAQNLLSEFRNMNCDKTVHDWADQKLQDKIRMSQMGFFDI